MNGQAMIDRCEERFGDTGNAIVTANEWLAYINSAYRTFLRASKWPNLVAETTASIPANGRTVALPSAALQGGVVSVFTTGPPVIPLEKQPPDLPIRNIRHWTDRPTIPVYYELRGSRISVLPAWTAGGSLTIAYLTAPTALTTSTSPVIPETYHDALVSGALAQAYRDDGNAELATHYEGEFRYMIEGAMRESGEEK